MRSRVNEDLSFRKLEVFLAYMKAGSMMGAAELLDSSVISVHRAIRSLEGSLRCTLFRRVGRNLVPTAAAYLFAKTAEDVLDRMESGIISTREAAGYSADRFKIGSLYSLTSYLMPELIKAMGLRKPNVQCELILGRSKHDLLPKLREGALDAVFAEVTTPDSDILSIPIFDDSIYFAAPPDSSYASLPNLDLRCCAGERIATLTEGPLTSYRLRETFPDFKPTIVMEVEDIFTLMNLVANGVAYALVHGRIRDMFEHKVKFIPLIQQMEVPQTIGVCFMRARERDPNLLALASVVRLFMNRK